MSNMNAIISKCGEKGYDYSVRRCILGYEAIDVACRDRAEYESVLKTFIKNKSLYCYEFPYCYSVRIFKRADYEDICAVNKDKMSLVTVFYEKRREGMTNGEAVLEVEKYAKENDMTRAYELIYA